MTKFENENGIIYRIKEFDNVTEKSFFALEHKIVANLEINGNSIVGMVHKEHYLGEIVEIKKPVSIYFNTLENATQVIPENGVVNITIKIDDINTLTKIIFKENDVIQGFVNIEGGEIKNEQNI